MKRSLTTTLVVLISASPYLGCASFQVTCPTRRRARISLTQQHVIDSMDVSSIDTFFQTQPYASAFLTCSVKAGTADFVAQSQPQLLGGDDPATDEDKVFTEENSIPFVIASDITSTATTSSLETSSSSATSRKSEGVDPARNLAFILYGGIYQGVFQEFLYGTLFPQWFGHDTSFQTVATSVLADQFFFAPVTCLPCAYMIKSFIMTDNALDKPKETVQKGIDKYIEDVKERGLLLKFWTIWIPVQCLTFSVVPEHFRILFIACVSFFWMFILSAVSSETNTINTSITATAEAKVIEELTRETMQERNQ